jgi:hypothetical protein
MPAWAATGSRTRTPAVTAGTAVRSQLRMRPRMIHLPHQRRCLSFDTGCREDGVRQLAI